MGEFSELPVMVFDTDPWAIEDFRIVLDPSYGSAAHFSAVGPGFEAELHRPFAGSGGLAEIKLTIETDGAAAVAAAQRALEEGQPFAAVFVDAGAPPANWGLEVAEAIRALDPEVQIVLTVARCDLDPVNLCARIPPADRLSLLAKPIHAQEMQHLVLAAAARRADDRARVLARRGPRDEAGGVLADLAIGLIAVNRDGLIAVAAGAIASFFPDLAGKLVPGGVLPNDLKALLAPAARPPAMEQPFPLAGMREIELANGRRLLAVPVPARDGERVSVFMDISEREATEDPRRGIRRRPEARAGF